MTNKIVPQKDQKRDCLQVMVPSIYNDVRKKEDVIKL